METRPLMATIFLLLATLAFTGLTTAQDSDQSSIEWIDCRKQVPLSVDPTAFDLDNLPTTLHCGRITVPMDYSKPISAQNNITLALAMYRPEKRPQEVVFFNPGGSDEATVFAWQIAYNQTTLFSELLDYDIMMMDVRGSYHSNPLNVDLEVFNDLLGPYPTTQEEFNMVYNASRNAFKSWADWSSPPGIPEFVGTREVVEDFEAIRSALCYNEINFVGASYGSFRAVQYASTYPSRVGNFLLDGSAPHGVSLFTEAQDEVASANRGLLRVDALCQKNSSCSFRSGGKGSIPKAFQMVLNKADETPLSASLCVNSTTCMSPVTGSGIQLGLQNLLLSGSQSDFLTIIQAIETALQGDASIFATYAFNPIPSVTAVWTMPLLCSDYDLEDNTFEAFRNSYDAGEKIDAVSIGKTQAWQIQLWCSGRPYPTPPNIPLPLPKPMLLVTADFDIDAPTEWTRQLWLQNPTSALVIRHGDGHVSITIPDAPSNPISEQFIRTGVLPTAKNDSSLSVYTAGMKLGAILDPYV